MTLKGYKHTPEAKAKIRAAAMGNTNTKGMKHTDETKAKMSAAHKGRKASQETKDKLSIAAKARKATPKTRAILSAAHTNPSNEIRARISASLKGRKASQETKDKLSVMRKGEKFTPEHRANIVKANTGRIVSMGTRAKITGVGNPNWKGGHDVSRAKTEEKRRGFGFIPLNDWFIGCNGHHLDTEFVVYIPEEMHTSIRHSVLNNINMGEINALALDYVYGD